MSAPTRFWLLCAALLGVTFLCIKPLGIYIAGVFAKDIRDVGVYTKNPALGSVCKVIY